MTKIFVREKEENGCEYLNGPFLDQNNAKKFLDCMQKKFPSATYTIEIEEDIQEKE